MYKPTKEEFFRLAIQRISNSRCYNILSLSDCEVRFSYSGGPYETVGCINITEWGIGWMGIAGSYIMDSLIRVKDCDNLSYLQAGGIPFIK